MNRKLPLKILVLVGLMVLALACNKAPGNENNPASNQAPASQGQEEKTDDKAQEKIKAEGSLFFPSKAYVQNGDSNAKYIQAKASIDYDSNKKDLVDAVLALLQEGPGKDGDLKDATNFVPKGSILKTDVKDSIATIDVSKSALAGGGDLDEELFIGQIVKSLTSFSEIDGVRFLVDGQEAESILGHYDISNGRVFQSVD